MINNTTEPLWIVAVDGEVIDVVDDVAVANEIVEYHREDEELSVYTEKEYETIYGGILVVDDDMGVVTRFLDIDDATDFIMDYPTEDQLFIFTEEEYKAARKD